MKYILILLISLNALAEIKYTRFQGDSNQGELIVADTAEFIERALKMIKVKNGWMKCEWKADVHALDIKTSSTFNELITPDDPLTLEIDESVYADVIVDTYCHPKNFNFVEDVDYQANEDIKKAKKEADDALMEALKLKVEDKSLKLEELLDLLKLKGII
jgi:hypothetical protein